MVCICTPLGLHPPHFFPEKAGKDYELTPYLEVLKDFRDDFTVISGLSHPDVGPSHDSNYSFLTGAPHPEQRAGFRNTHLARPVRGRAHRRPDALPQPGAVGRGLRPVLDAQRRAGAGGLVAVAACSPGCSSTAGPTRSRPRSAASRTAGASSTTSATRPRQLQSGLGADDRDKLDEYFTSVRELEQRLAQAEEWAKKPKPKVDAKPPQDITNAADLIGRTRLLFDLIHLALQTDSTRLVTIMLLGTSLRAADPGRDAGPPRPVAPRQGPGQDRAAQDRRTGDDEDRCATSWPS